MSNITVGNEKNILFYSDEEGNTKVEVLLENEDVWLNADALSTLFNIDRSGIVRHINNIYKDEELSKSSVYSFFEHTAEEGIEPNKHVLIKFIILNTAPVKADTIKS